MGMTGPLRTWGCGGGSAVGVGLGAALLGVRLRPLAGGLDVGQDSLGGDVGVRVEEEVAGVVLAELGVRAAVAVAGSARTHLDAPLVAVARVGASPDGLADVGDDGLDGDESAADGGEAARLLPVDAGVGGVLGVGETLPAAPG